MIKYILLSVLLLAYNSLSAQDSQKLDLAKVRFLDHPFLFEKSFFGDRILRKIIDTNVIGGYSENFSKNCKMTHYRGARNKEEQIYSYDETGRLTAYREINPRYDKDIFYTVTHERDNQKLTITQKPNKKGSEVYYTQSVSYFNEAGLIHKVDYFLCASDSRDTMKTTTTCIYDEQKKIIQSKYVTNAKYGLNSNITYEYDKIGLVKKQSDHSNNSFIEYEDLIRDSLGYKVLVCNRIVNNSGNVQKSKYYTMLIDSLDNIISYDDNTHGEDIGATNVKYFYQNALLLKSVSVNETSYAIFTTENLFTYDDQNRVIAKRVKYKSKGKAQKFEENHDYTYQINYENNTFTLLDPNKAFGGVTKSVSEFKCFE